MKRKYFFILACVFLSILFLRRPDTFLTPQFWAEDGKIWYSDAYNEGGVESLLSTQDGYFQTFSRLAAVIALPFPIEHAPLVFNILASLILILPALFFLSSRFENIVLSYPVRIFIASVYVLLPNTAEIYVNVTNAQWFLALLAFLVLIASENQKWYWRLFDLSVLLIAGLSGPFAILLLPISFLLWFLRRRKLNLVNLLVIASTAGVQFFAIFYLTGGDRVQVIPELTVRLIFAILGRQIIWNSIIGSTGYLWVLEHISWYFWLIALGTVLALFLTAHAVYKAPMELKLFILFAILIFISSLISPTGDFSEYTPLKLLSRSMDGVRYWLVPMLAFITTLIWNVGRKRYMFFRVLAGIFLVTMSFGVILDFRHPKFVDYKFSKYIVELSKLEKGQKMTIPINPSGWSMELIKKEE